MSTEILQNSTKTLVPSRYYDIFGLRVMGCDYKTIAEKTGYSYQHIRNIFARSGVLYEFWRHWCDEHKKEALEEATDMEWGQLPDIVRANIISAKDTKTMVGVAARKMIFDRTFGRPEDRIKINANVAVVNFSDWIMKQTLLKRDEDKNEQDQTREGVNGADAEQSH